MGVDKTVNKLLHLYHKIVNSNLDTDIFESACIVCIADERGDKETTGRYQRKF